jgi:Uma2 family endonuclease
MPAAPAIDEAILESSVDQRVFFRNARWSDYEAALAMRGESSAVRIAYLEGVLEFISPSRDHEMLKKKWARLLEAYCEELGIDLHGFGSWTLEKRELERGAEPDECYSLNVAAEVPDLAIEVIWTSGGLNKLEIYRLLGVGEVWVWKRGEISVFRLREEHYEHVQSSELLPQIDLTLLDQLLNEPSDQPQAVRELRGVLRSR